MNTSDFTSNFWNIYTAAILIASFVGLVWLLVSQNKTKRNVNTISLKALWAGLCHLSGAWAAWGPPAWTLGTSVSCVPIRGADQSKSPNQNHGHLGYQWAMSQLEWVSFPVTESQNERKNLNFQLIFLKVWGMLLLGLRADTPKISHNGILIILS